MRFCVSGSYIYVPDEINKIVIDGFQRGREAKGHNPIQRLMNMDRNNRSSLLLLRRPKLLETKTRK